MLMWSEDVDEYYFSWIRKFIIGWFNLSLWIPCRVNQSKEKRGIKVEEEFATLREFNKKFPSKLYICSRCKSLVTDPYHCINCNNQSNSFLFTQNTYSYSIQETGIKEVIFKPIELEKGK